MNIVEMTDLLQADLRNEYKHMNFYLYHSTSLVGLHAEEYKEIFAEEAKSEMAHIQQFSNLLWGLNVKPHHYGSDIVLTTDVRTALEYAHKMESEVVDNYAKRLDQCADLVDCTTRHWLEVFLEEQLMHSRQDVDRFARLLAG